MAKIRFLTLGAFFGLALLTAALFWQLSGRPGPSLRSRETVVMRLQALERLEVFEARLLAHESHREPAWFNTNEFLIVAKGTAIYGVELGNAQIEVTGKRVTVNLPPVKLLNLIMNPAELEFLGLKKGLLTSQQGFEDIKRSAAIDLQQDLSRQARDPGLMAAAEANARKLLQSLMISLGHEEVIINFNLVSQKP